jgi:hypothetical protein
MEAPTAHGHVSGLAVFDPSTGAETVTLECSSLGKRRRCSEAYLPARGSTTFSAKSSTRPGRSPWIVM